jgi:hypothetical protein
MRTPEDICLLCKTRKATKTQSHIIPRFMTKSIFGLERRRGYLLDIGNAHKPTEVTQDSDKEDYILCPECEKFIEICETYFAARIQNRLWKPHFENQFFDSNNGHGIRRKICNEANQWIFRLFIYSIVWRCSISQTKTHSSFSLGKEEEEILRSILSEFISSSQSELLALIETRFHKISVIPFVIFTAESFNSKTGNVISSNPYSKNPYYIELNEYTLLITFVEQNKLEVFKFLLNDDDSKIKIGFFSNEIWIGLKNDYLKRSAEEAIKQMNARGLTPYVSPNG